MFENYTRAVVKEIESMHTNDDGNGEAAAAITLDTIYLGGGTPSLAPLSMLEAIMAAVKQNFKLSPNLEFTMEMDPGTFDRTKLRGFCALGVNRISLGVQSFDDHVLEYLGRFHRKADIQHSLQLLQDLNSEGNDDDFNYSIDLIASLPGVSLADWCTTLAKAVKLTPPPKHISVYDLTIEAGTVFGKWYDAYGDDEYDNRRENHASQGTLSHRPLPSAEESAFQYQYAAGYLRAWGYEHYEISSYALPGRRSLHNQLYWGYQSSWYAAGLGSTSYVNTTLTARPRAMADYIAWVNRSSSAMNTTIKESSSSSTSCIDGKDDEEESMASRLQDLVLKRLRTKEGLNLDFVRQRYGHDYADSILQGACLDLNQLVTYEPPVLRLIDSKGLMFSNSIISSIFVAIDEANLENMARGRSTYTHGYPENQV